MQENKLKKFIKKRKQLFWSLKPGAVPSREIILEKTLNYGTWEDVMKLINILKMKQASKLFNKINNKKPNNLIPQISNYFEMYFRKYAR